MESDIADRLRRYFVTQRNQWNVADEIERLRKERDEARREVCYAEINGQYGRRYIPQDIAKEKGWDCFKENTNG